MDQPMQQSYANAAFHADNGYHPAVQGIRYQTRYSQSETVLPAANGYMVSVLNAAAQPPYTNNQVNSCSS